jgi:uncharacterized protein YlxP (DUF503 family)
MPTTIGLVHLRLNITQASSLKDKRRVIKSLKDRVRRQHNVSIAEVDDLDNRRWSTLIVAMVGNDETYVQGGLQKIVNAVALHRDMILAESQIELL